MQQSLERMVARIEDAWTHKSRDRARARDKPTGGPAPMQLAYCSDIRVAEQHQCVVQLKSRPTLLSMMCIA